MITKLLTLLGLNSARRMQNKLRKLMEQYAELVKVNSEDIAAKLLEISNIKKDILALEKQNKELTRTKMTVDTAFATNEDKKEN